MANDQLLYHELVVREFIAELPRPDYTDYRSATTPGYHTIVAALATLTSHARPALQLIGSLFTIGLLATLGLAVGARAPPVLAIAACAPILTSLYVWPAGVWLLPDNAGWWGVLAVLLAALNLAGPGAARPARRCLLAGAILALLVFMRQIHLWSAALVWTAAWLSLAPRHPAPSRSVADEWHALTSRPPARIGRTMLAIACTLPSFAIVGLFVSMWDGLTPPMFQTGEHGEVGYHGGNPAAPAFVLSIFAIVSAFYAGFLADTLMDIRRAHKRWALLAALAGALLALLPATTHSIEAGRWSGLWNVAAHVPDIAGRTSPLILALSTLGAVLALAWSLALERRDRWIMLATLVAFSAAMSASHELWHRYVEPLVLLLVTLMAVRVRPADAPPSPAHAPHRALRRDALLRASRVIGPLLLAGGFAVLTAFKISTARVFDPPATHAPAPTTPSRAP